MTTTEPETFEPANIRTDLPRNVIEAIRRVMLELPGIAKEMPEEHRKKSGRSSDDGKGINYAYRSIEQITGNAQDLSAVYGVVFTPRNVQLVSEREFQMGSRDTRWVDVTLDVEYRIYGPGGRKDKIDVGPVRATGRDNSDKGYTKAMTQAFKIVLLQVFQIGDPQDEGEHQHYEQDGYVEGVKVVSVDMAEAMLARIEALPPEHKAALRDQWKEANLPIPAMLTNEQYGQADALIQLHVIQMHKDPGPTGDPLNLGADAVDPDPDGARGHLGEIVDALGMHDRTMLESHLRGRFGVDAAGMTPDQLDEAIAIASAWPPPASEPEPPPTLPAPQEGPLAGLIPPGVPLAVQDEVIAEVRMMKVDELKEELRAREIATTGNASDLRIRLTAAKLTEWSTASTGTPVEA